jgi:hypothetical protein
MSLSFLVAALASGLLAQGATQKPAGPPAGNTPPAVDVRIVEAGDAKELKWPGVQTPAVSLPLTIENHGKEPLNDVAIHATPFLGSGRSAGVKLAAAEIQSEGQASPYQIAKLDSRQSREIVLKATLPAAGTYRTVVRVWQGGVERVRTVIEVERTRNPPPVEIPNVPAEQTSTFLSTTSVDFTATIVPTGEPITLDKPFLQAVTYTPRADGSVASKATTVSLKEGAAIPVGSAPAPVTLTLEKLDRPGRYDATVRFTGSGYSGKDVALSVYVREPWWLAVFFIAAGLFVSYQLRKYTSFTRPRLLNEKKAAALFSELQEHGTLAAGDPQALGLVQDVRRALTEHWNEAVREGTLSNLKSLDVYDRKVRLLPAWILARKSIANLRPASLKGQFAGQLDAARKVLLDRAATTDDVDEQISSLDGLPAEIDTAVRAELTKQAGDLKKQLDADGRPEAQAIAADVGKIQSALAKGDLAAAADELDALQRKYYLFLGADLSARLTPHPPPGVEVPEWATTVTAVKTSVTRIQQARTGVEAVDAFRVGLALYLETAATGLIRAATTKIAAGTKVPARYQQVVDAAGDVVTKVRSGDLMTAWKALDRTSGVYRRILEDTLGGTLGAVEKTGLDVLATLAAAPSGLELEIFDFGSGGTSAEELQKTGAMDLTASRLQASGSFFLIVIVILAVLIGLKTLWIDNFVWGGWASYLAAFLWGVAFDQFGQAGLTALIRK